MTATESTTRSLTVRIKRYDPEADKEPRWQEFKVNAEPWDRVLDVIQKIKWDQDESLALRRSCTTEFAARTRCGSTARTVSPVKSSSRTSRATT